MDTAFKKFFKEHTGFPKFKSKKTHKFSYKFKCVNNNIEYLGKHIKLPKLGLVKTKNKLIPKGRILSTTIEKVGIDLGIKNFVITSDGIKIPNPKHLQKSLKKLARLQRRLSRKTRDGANYKRARIKVAKLQEKIRNQRKDPLHQLSSSIAKEYDIICIEDLQVKNMQKKS